MRNNNVESFGRTFNDNETENTSALTSKNATESNVIQVPKIQMPSGGGALKGIDEKFEVNPTNGTGSFSIGLPISTGRNNFSPALGLQYNSGSGNGVFGLGWSVGVPAIVLKTDNGLPQYRGDDTYQISGAEDLVPCLEETNPNTWEVQEKITGDGYQVKQYRPRLEGSFSRIERVYHPDHGIYWKLTSPTNITTIYGRSTAARIANPEDETQIFQWLAEFSFDDKGNWIKYTYKPEDLENIPNTIFEEQRLRGKLKFTNQYLKRVQYGNRKPYYIDDTKPYDPVDPTLVKGSDEEEHFFELVFDYGEHDELIPEVVAKAGQAWLYRPDAFSSRRSGFEIRTNRLCQRVLMFHKFEELGLTPCLVSSTQLNYTGSNINEAGGSEVSYLVSVEQSGYIRKPDNSYSKKSTPTISLEYQKLNWDTTMHTVDADSIQNAPTGLANNYQWVDLFQEGISGILSEHNGEWFYKENYGNEDGGVAFTSGKQVVNRPSVLSSENATVALVDLESSGARQLEVSTDGLHGYHTLNAEKTHLKIENFKPFKHTPNINKQAANVRYLDLTGDGKPDLVVTEESALVWYASKGFDGYDEAVFAAKALDELDGPSLAFADREETIFLADFTGDGLTDIIRIRNGEVCYWANLGYGKFSGKITMGNAPTFDHPDHFNSKYIHLADISGTGATDIIYLGKNKFRAFINNNGNTWSDAHEIDPFTNVHSEGVLSVIDLLGTGTSCIVWSSKLSADSPMRYIDLMGSKMPHVLIGYKNNTGKEVRFEYKSSTHFYLEDKRAGKPWVTKLPFPVQVISKVIHEDKISKTIFTKTNTYHHGYYDFVEREFRGFGRVESKDTEAFSEFKLNVAKNIVEEERHQPPVKTVMWYHTGNHKDEQDVLHQLEEEYFKNGLFTEHIIPQNPFQDNLSADEVREAFRALKGVPMRIEVYAEDDSDKSTYPYTCQNHSYNVKRIQPKGANEYASFLVLPSEEISYSYDRNPADPRIGHSFVLETDDLGNITKNASVIYPRVSRPIAPHAIPDRVWDEQNKLHIVYGEIDYTNDVIFDHAYRLRVGYENRAYELSGIAQPVDFFFDKTALFNQIQAASTILYEEDFTLGIQRRLTAHGRTYLMKDDLSGALPLGELTPLGFVYDSHQLAFTKNLVSKYYGTKVNDAMLLDAKYVHLEGDEHWWTRGGRVIYDVNPKDNFYLPLGNQDVYGNSSSVTYDDYNLFIREAANALGHTVISEHDYRTLGVVLQTDTNLNRSAIETDELGIVIKTALMGKDGAGEGDTLAHPTTEVEYDLFNWQINQKPNYIHNSAREEHGVPNPIWQHSYSYFNGGGSVIMTKVQAEAGIAKKWNPITKTVDDVNADPRWVGNGRTIVDNKGNTIKTFEPYFSDTHEFEDEDALVETGFSATIYYDAAGRKIRTEMPDGTFMKFEFDAWHNKTYDAVDTVKDGQWYVDRGSPDPTIDPEPFDSEERAAWLAAKHYRTPVISHANTLGQNIYSISDYGNGKTVNVFAENDLAKRYTKAFDQLGRQVSEGYTNMLKSAIYAKTAEKGERWIFSDVTGRLVKIWDNALFELRTTFDELGRPISNFVKQNGVETVYNHIVYGDILPDPVAANMLGKTYKIFDQSGVITLKNIDFKGNVTEIDRTLCSDYKNLIDWSALEGLIDIVDINATALPLLEAETFTSSTTLDAMNRPVLTALPDGSVLRPTYDKSNMLKNLEVQVRGVGAFETYMLEQSYDAKGQRTFVKLGNGMITNYFYDPKTFRLINLVTKTDGGIDANAIQNLKYTYDPVGNIVRLKDDAQQTHYFKNAVVQPESHFEYDAIYQLIKATGREHAVVSQPNHEALAHLSELPQTNNPAAVRNYTQTFEYDDLGNILEMKHIATGGNWTRRYNYTYQSNPLDVTNRLGSTSLPGDPVGGPYSDTYTYDSHGNMTKMGHLNSLSWNFIDQLRSVDLGGGGNSYYVYDVQGNRVRKVIERIGGKRLERIYLGSVEIYREYQGVNKKLERNTLHISDNTRTIAQVDTKLFDPDNTDLDNPLNVNLIRYQYSNHIGSASIETDASGAIISYEEYHPFGTSSYRNSRSGTNLSLKRYRFTGQERDNETGLYHMGARYCATWLGRWTSSDPAGFVDGFNLYRYSRNNPIRFSDPSGTDPTDPDDAQDRVITETPQNVMDQLGTDSDEARAIIDAHFTIGSIVQGAHGRYRIIDGSRFVNGRNILTWEEVTSGFDGGGDGANDAQESTTEESTSEPEPESEPVATPETPTETRGGGEMQSAGGALIRQGPPGETILVPDTVDDPKLGRLNEHARQGFLTRNGGRENPTSTRRSSQVQKDALAEFQRRNPRPSTNHAAGHRVDMMYDGTNRIGDHWRDYIWEDGATNTNDGFEGWRRVRNHPFQEPAGGAARVSEADQLRNSTRFRTGIRYTGAGFTAVGVGFSGYGLYNDIQEGDVAMGVGDGLSLAGGGLELYAFYATTYGSAGSTLGGATVTVGGASVALLPLGIVLSGAGVAVTSGVSGVRAYEQGDTAGAVAGGVGVAAGTALAVGGGIALASAAGVAMAPAVVAAAPVLIVGGAIAALGVGAFHAGRYFNWW